MRGLILGVLAMLATIGAAHAENCAGSGSPTLLTLVEWRLVPGGGGTVELIYRLQETRPVTLLQAHIYFEIGSGNFPAEAMLTLQNAGGLAQDGTATVVVGKQVARRLAAAVPGNVVAYFCTGVAAYLDGREIIID